LRTIRDFYPACGAALIDTLRAALGDAFTPEVEAAWSAVFAFVAANMIKGIDAAERALAAEHSLRDTLLGDASRCGVVTGCCFGLGL
jgi:hemoglobin-like flavoprotein